MTLLALVAGAVLAGLLAHRLESSRLGPVRGSLARAAGGSAPKIVVAVYLLLSIAFLILRAAAGTSGLYDRYLWGIAVALLILLPMRPRVARRGGRLLHAGALGAVLLLAAVSLVVVVEENTSSAARWEAGKAAVARGTAATAVDAGFEWMGWHYPRIVGDETGPRLWRDPATWYNVLKFPSAGNCVLMSFAPRRESWLNLIEVRKYQTFVLWGSRPLFVYRNPRACAAGPS
jgi:hypothetical protein